MLILIADSALQDAQLMLTRRSILMETNLIEFASLNVKSDGFPKTLQDYAYKTVLEMSLPISTQEDVLHNVMVKYQNGQITVQINALKIVLYCLIFLPTTKLTDAF